MSLSCKPIVWGMMYCHNSCYQEEVHETRMSPYGLVMVPEQVYAIQRVFTDWDAGIKPRSDGFRRIGQKSYQTANEAREACQRHKFETMVTEIASMI